MTRVYTRGTPIERLFEHLVLTESGCWIYDGATSHGYGRVNCGGGRYTAAHVVTYEHFVGPVPDGLELDHLCRVRRCANPWHVEPVTHRVNSLRGDAPSVVAHREGRCFRGHPASDSYRRLSTGRVVYCRACRREKKAAA